ncbi:hypothetical protein DL93DRAFT_1856482 [Clavulina sp. PMI_390]|nr:hypothetical protein DL93DRAFT_1856482 [Clavulina sp. PMI_390]
MTVRSLSTQALAKRPPTSAVPPSKPKPAPRKAKSPPTVFAITDEQWARLRACPSCDSPWTARKSIKGKVTHVRSCAKEHFISPESLEGIVLTRLSEMDAQPTQTASSSTALNNGPATLLDDVVQANTAVPRRRRRVVAEDSIPSANGDWNNVPTPSNSTSLSTIIDLGSPPRDEVFPSTQLPPPSRFAATRHSILDEDHSEGDADSPPSSTQQLPTSRLRGTSSVRSLMSLVDFAADPSIDPLPPVAVSEYRDPALRHY